MEVLATFKITFPMRVESVCPARRANRWLRLPGVSGANESSDTAKASNVLLKPLESRAAILVNSLLNHYRSTDRIEFVAQWITACTELGR